LIVLFAKPAKLMKALTLLFLLTCAHLAYSQQPDTLKYCINNRNIGVGGFDPLSYFQGSTPITGSEKFSATVDGVTYRFSSETNLRKFKANPTKYLPQFGGWCSMTLAMGRATTPKYDNFVVTSGKLYLFERTVSVNGRELWLKDPKANEKIASANYTSYRTTGKIK
jgi:YHS domain-containing protein